MRSNRSLSNVEYHLQELEIANDNTSANHIMPEFSENEAAILDIGCGIGQTLSASGLVTNHLLVGLDVDHTSLAFKQRRFDIINFVNGCSEHLPFKRNTFDFVLSRVTLSYINIPVYIIEIKRVLKSNGRLWITLHPLSKILHQLKMIFGHLS